MTKAKIFEWLGVGTAIFYSLLIAMNIGGEFIGFTFCFSHRSSLASGRAWESTEGFFFFSFSMPPQGSLE